MGVHGGSVIRPGGVLVVVVVVVVVVAVAVAEPWMGWDGWASHPI